MRMFAGFAIGIALAGAVNLAWSSDAEMDCQARLERLEIMLINYGDFCQAYVHRGDSEWGDDVEIECNFPL